MKWMGVFAALGIVTGGAVPALADDAPSWTYTSDWNEGLLVGENFEGLNVGDDVNLGPLDGNLGGTGVPFLVIDENPDLVGNELDGDSEGTEGAWAGFSFDEGSFEAPTDGTYYIQGTSDNHGGNYSMGVWNSARGTQYNTTYNSDGGWGWGFGPNGAAHSGGDIFDDANPHTSIHAVNVEGGFVTTYSFEAHDRVTGASWGHGGDAGVPNHIPGFGTPTLRLFYDRRGGQNVDADEFRIGTTPFLGGVIPEPATFALLGLGSLLMLRRRA
jgi:hypothetical protein